MRYRKDLINGRLRGPVDWEMLDRMKWLSIFAKEKVQMIWESIHSWVTLAKGSSRGTGVSKNGLNVPFIYAFGADLQLPLEETWIVFIFEGCMSVRRQSTLSMMHSLGLHRWSPEWCTQKGRALPLCVQCASTNLGENFNPSRRTFSPPAMNLKGQIWGEETL